MKYLFFLIFFLFALTTSASHSVGADITYTNVSGNTYDICLHFYRDCAGIAAPIQVSFVVTSASCGYTSTNPYSQPIADYVSYNEVAAACGNTTSTCNGGTYTGVQEYIYKTTTTLPSCSDVIISYRACCRNSAISDIYNPASTWMYVYAMVNTITGNNSATFNSNPAPFECQNQFFCYDNGATDIDGDVLTYSLQTPYDNAGLNVTYITPPYSYTQPILTTGSPTFDASTGKFCMSPSLNQIGICAILVSEYRSGVLVGQTLRDIQLIVKACPCSIGLPITLTDFYAKRDSSSIKVVWVTESEQDNDYFELYHADGTLTFIPMARIYSLSKAPVKTWYAYVDSLPYQGVNYYKLEQCDYDGTTRYVGTVAENFEYVEGYDWRKYYNIIGQQIK